MSTEWVKLSQTEINEKGSELADAIGELYRIRAEKKEAMNNFKSEIDFQERKISDLSQTVRLGRELRSTTFFDDKIDN